MTNENYCQTCKYFASGEVFCKEYLDEIESGYSFEVLPKKLYCWCLFVSRRINNELYTNFILPKFCPYKKSKEDLIDYLNFFNIKNQIAIQFINNKCIRENLLTMNRILNNENKLKIVEQHHDKL